VQRQEDGRFIGTALCYAYISDLRGALDPVTTFCLITEELDDLVARAVLVQQRLDLPGAVTRASPGALQDGVEVVRCRNHFVGWRRGG
jgi:hypothetical protein